jgi:hypothetical protein
MAHKGGSDRPGDQTGAVTEYEAQRQWKQQHRSGRQPETLAAEVAILWLVRHGVRRNLAPVVAELAGVGGIRR